MTQKPDIVEQAKELAASALQNMESRHIPAMDVNKQPDEAQPQNLLGQRRQTREPPERKLGFSQLGQPGCL